MGFAQAVRSDDTEFAPWGAGGNYQPDTPMWLICIRTDYLDGIAESFFTDSSPAGMNINSVLLPTGTAVMSGSGSSQAVASVTVTNKGTDYTFADITFSAGSASANATIAPPSGHGTDPVSELGGFFVGINTQLSGAGGAGADLTVGNDFRQISLIKNPTNFGTTTIGTASTLKAMNALDFASGVSVASFTVDELLTGGTSGANAYVVQIDAGNGYVYFTQNSKTGYKPFTNGETVTGGSSAFSGAIESSNGVLNPEVNRGSGEMLFLENRNPINRSTTQIEDIKVIIEF